MSEPRADCALVSMQTGQAVTTTAVGVGVSIWTAAVVERPWIFVAAGLLGVVAGVGVARLVARPTRRWWGKVPVEDLGPLRRSSEAAVWIGGLWGLVSIVVGAAVLVVEVQLFDDTTLYQLGGPLMLVFGASAAMSRRELLRWQERNGVWLCTRTGVRRFAWTASHARARLVAIPTASVHAEVA